MHADNSVLSYAVKIKKDDYRKMIIEMLLIRNKRYDTKQMCIITKIELRMIELRMILFYKSKLLGN